MHPLAFAFPLAAAVLAGCTAEGPRAGREDAFAAEVRGMTAGTPQRCVPTSPGTNLYAVDRRTVAVRRGAETFVNRIDHDCPGLEPLATIIVEVHGSQYCNGDRIRALEPGRSIPGPYCRLNDFTPYRKAP
jgi:hypothetical protein